MADAKDLKTIIERNSRAIRLRPGIGQGTAVTTCRMRPGHLACDIEDGPWKLTADEMPVDGGDGLGPDPGVLVRAGLGSCIAMGYVQWGAYLGVPLDAVEVRVETDYDARGMFGLEPSMPPGWTAVRYITTIASPAPVERVRELADLADARSPILDDLRREGDITRELRIASGVS